MTIPFFMARRSWRGSNYYRPLSTKEPSHLEYGGLDRLQEWEGDISMYNLSTGEEVQITEDQECIDLTSLIL